MKKQNHIFRLKKHFSLLLSGILLGLSCFIPTASAEAVEASDEVQIIMDNETITETENGKYTYIVDSLEELPVLSCKFDKTKYSVLVTQPTRENGYIGTVTVTDIASNSVTVHTVNVYDNNTFQSHFINLGGDPWVTYVDGWYYYMVTGNGFYISKSRELERVNSNPVSVFTLSDLVDGKNFSIVKELWAPELHFIDGYWYIYFTAYDGESYKEGSTTEVTGSAKNHRMYVLKSDTSDAQGSYTFMGQLNELESDYINDPEQSDTDAPIKTGHYAIDQSVFEWNGKLYAVWSGWSAYTNVDQRIFIAEMSDPCTISSNRVELSRPEYAYETYSVIPAINEAPQALISPDGKTLNIAFSVNRFDDSHYSLGLLTLKEGGNPLNAQDWIKTDEPVFEPCEENSTYSVGHCSFVPSPDGSEYYVVYHARRGEDTAIYPREIRTQQFYWNDDGTPCFDKAISADTPVQLPSGTALIDRTRLEAENGKLSGDAYIPTTEVTTYDPDYYSGGKRVALTSSGSAVTFTYNAEKSGKYTLTLLASGNSNTKAGFSVTVNGTEYTKQIHGGMGNINIFAFYDMTGIDLTEGENTIVVSYTSAYKNGAYLDRLDITNEENASAAWERQDSLNNQSTKAAVIREKTVDSIKQPEYNTEYVFNDFGDFDKYWYSTQPFVDDPEYENVITTCRAGGNKRLLVTGEEFRSIADFKASVEIIPAATHDNSINPSMPVADETGINSGILFRVGKMLDYTTNVCTFDGYRCILTVKDGSVVMQLSRYYFVDDTAVSSTNKLLNASASTLAYTAGDTYVMEVTAIGNTVNAKAYNKNDPDTVITIDNQSIVTSVANTIDSGRIGLFVNCGSRVTFANMKVTPYYSPAGLTCDYGNLNQLSAYTAYSSAASRVHSVDQGVISIPTGCSKLILNNNEAQNVADFTANAKIKLTSTTQLIQAGLAFRISDVTTGTPGLTGYAVFLQRTSSHANNTIIVNLTKYGTKGTSANVNLGNQSFADTTLLSDITAKTDITGLEFDFAVKVIGNKMQVTVTRVDKPALTSTYNWVINSDNYSMNQNYPIYYESGMIGIFSNGVAEMSEIAINKIRPENHSVTLKDAENGSAVASVAQAVAGKEVTLTVRADSGYYIDPEKITVTLSDGTTVGTEVSNTYWDTVGAYTFTLPDDSVNINCSFTPILKGDSNSDSITDIKDLIRSKKHIAGIDQAYALSNADVDGDGIINALDLIGLRKILLEK